MTRPILLYYRDLIMLGSSREWGIPSHCYIGKVWYSKDLRTMTCCLPIPDDPGHLRTETRSYLIVDRPQDAWAPRHWCDAGAEYAKQWPASARSRWWKR